MFLTEQDWFEPVFKTVTLRKEAFQNKTLLRDRSGDLHIFKIVLNKLRLNVISKWVLVQPQKKLISEHVN
jgi:hypothetical protein